MVTLLGDSFPPAPGTPLPRPRAKPEAVIPFELPALAPPDEGEGDNGVGDVLRGGVAAKEVEKKAEERELGVWASLDCWVPGPYP